jgi:hypothetical protein
MTRYYLHLTPADRASFETLAGDDGTTVLVGVQWEADLEVRPGDDLDFTSPAMTVHHLGIVPGDCGSGNGDPDWTQLEDDRIAPLGFETRPTVYRDTVTGEMWLEAYEVMRPLSCVTQPTWEALMRRRHDQLGGETVLPWRRVVQVLVEQYDRPGRISVAAVLREALRRARGGGEG